MRLFRQASRRHSGESPEEIRLVYACATPEAPEPLVAVVRTHDEASALEVEVREHFPGAKVSWETFEVTGKPEEAVHIVSLGGPGTSVAGTEGAGNSWKDDPMGVAVFADRDDANTHAAAVAAAEGSSDYRVRSLPIGWRAPGWPFETSS